jgi:two-component system, OmpR family, sensor kinase
VNSFRSQIVASTVLLVAAVMAAVVLGTQLVLELGEHHPEARSPWSILLATGLVGACGVVLSGWVAWRVSHRALKPVRDMAERAEDWSAQNLARRFDLGPPVNELSQLGQTLDHLLDRVARAIRAEQRFSAELAHEIRTPLAAIRGSAELALLRKPADPGLRTDLTEIADGTRRLAEVVTALLELAANPGEALQATASPDAVIAEVSRLVPAQIELELTGSAPPIAGPLALVTRTLAPLVENAGQHAEKRVTMDLRARDLIEITVSDDGPGVPPDLRESIFEPGASTQGSSGLGLGIARRVARSLGGDVVLHGDEFVLRLPRAWTSDTPPGEGRSG